MTWISKIAATVLSSTSKKPKAAVVDDNARWYSNETGEGNEVCMIETVS